MINILILLRLISKEHVKDEPRFISIEVVEVPSSSRNINDIYWLFMM